MFDKTVIALSPRSVEHRHRTEVHEHRAPTDESVRLLREMQSAAEKDRVAGFHMEGNAFHGRVELFQNLDPPEMVAKAHFDINGRRMTVEARVSAWGRPERGELVQKLRDEMARMIAAEVLVDSLRGIRLPA